jgi:catechol 2,3-dioxygenase-like lactoylglutathione lyase family enzyme
VGDRDGSARASIDIVIGRLHHVVIDCPDPQALASFYVVLLGWPVTYRSDDFVVIAKNDTTSGVAFQLAPDHKPPRWPDPDYPQQIHLDVMVDDLDAADAEVVRLGAQRLSAGDHVYADPAGHPFCLIRRPSWAPPVQGAG